MVEEILKAAHVPAANYVLGNVMPAARDAGGDAPHGHVGGGQPEEEKMDAAGLDLRDVLFFGYYVRIYDSATRRTPLRSSGAEVDLPAPLGPAITKRLGMRAIFSLSYQPSTGPKIMRLQPQ
jgi:hypothetical protein